MTKPGPKKNTSQCIVDGCEGIYHANGICRIHYNRLRKTGRLNVLPTEAKEKLLAYSKVNAETGCWDWKSQNPHGYGFIWLGQKTRQAHRVSWETFKGTPIPKDKQINHKCHNRRCVNPDHLYLGTHQENMRDMVLAGRSSRGTKSRSAKLDDEKVRQIKRHLQKGIMQIDIANEFKVSTSCISAINMRETWTHIEVF